ncbi:hypothetical protein MTO96_025327 [Rhipicephalus appendiculatus]
MDASLYDHGCLTRLVKSNKLGCTGRSAAAGVSRSIGPLIEAFEVEAKFKQGRRQESSAWKNCIGKCAVFAAVPCPRKVGLGGCIYAFAAVHMPMDASLHDHGCLTRLVKSNKLGCTGRSAAAGVSRSIGPLIEAFEVEAKFKQGRRQESSAWKNCIGKCAVFAAVPCPRKVGLGGCIYAFAAVHMPMDASLHDHGCLTRLVKSNKLGCTGRSAAAGVSRSIGPLIEAFEVEAKFKQGRRQESSAWKNCIDPLLQASVDPLGPLIEAFEVEAKFKQGRRQESSAWKNCIGVSRSIGSLIEAFEVEAKFKQGKRQESSAWKSSIGALRSSDGRNLGFLLSHSGPFHQRALS